MKTEKQKPFPAWLKFIFTGFISLILSLFFHDEEIKFMMYTLLSFILICTGVIILEINKVLEQLNK